MYPWLSFANTVLLKLVNKTFKYRAALVCDGGRISALVKF